MGSYRLVTLLGRGGMGEVWRASHQMLARDAAIKLIQPAVLSGKFGSNATMIVRRFEQEAKATALLRSPHTVELYDFGVTKDGVFYYVMELLDGIDLETLVERQPGQMPAFAQADGFETQLRGNVDGMGVVTQQHRGVTDQPVVQRRRRKNDEPRQPAEDDIRAQRGVAFGQQTRPVETALGKRPGEPGAAGEDQDRVDPADRLHDFLGEGTAVEPVHREHQDDRVSQARAEPEHHADEKVHAWTAAGGGAGVGELVRGTLSAGSIITITGVAALTRSELR